jgi:hypothetical protein
MGDNGRAMSEPVRGEHRRRGSRTVALVAGVAVLVAAAVACIPIPHGGGRTAKLGNDLSNPACASRQYMPATSAPCGPNAMYWSAIQGPYEAFENGDPFTTLCARGVSPVGVAECSGAGRNPTYQPTGYEYAIEVGPADVNVPQTLQIWDPGVVVRDAGPASPYTAPGTMTNRSVSLTRVAGSRILNRASGAACTTGCAATFNWLDVGEIISGTGIPAGAIIVKVLSSTQIEINLPTNAEGVGGGATTSGTATATISNTYACNRVNAPFNAAPYSSLPDRGATSQSCQTGDSHGAANGSSLPYGSALQVQVFDNDGNDLAVGFDTPLTGCHLYVPRGDLSWYNWNKWRSVCTFTPTTTGIYPFRVKSSGITLPDGTVVPDSGSGWNAFSLRVTGGSDTELYGLGALSTWMNTPGTSPRLYLTEITSADAGKSMVVDLYDPGDGTGDTDFTVQILGPPSGTPGVVPTGGAVIPAAGLASECRYNPTVSPIQAVDVTGVDGAISGDCGVVTRVGGVNLYNNGWLRIRVDIDPAYTCTTDCWWALDYDFGVGIVNDRTVWKVSVVDRPVTEPTTTTSSVPEG